MSATTLQPALRKKLCHDSCVCVCVCVFVFTGRVLVLNEAEFGLGLLGSWQVAIEGYWRTESPGDIRRVKVWITHTHTQTRTHARTHTQTHTSMQYGDMWWASKAKLSGLAPRVYVCAHVFVGGVGCI